MKEMQQIGLNKNSMKSKWGIHTVLEKNNVFENELDEEVDNIIKMV